MIKFNDIKVGDYLMADNDGDILPGEVTDLNNDEKQRENRRLSSPRSSIKRTKCPNDQRDNDESREDRADPVRKLDHRL